MTQVTVQPDGHVTVEVGTKSQGQGHETVLAQVAADVLTVPMEWIHVVDGDTNALPYGMGTWGSRCASWAAVPFSAFSAVASAAYLHTFLLPPGQAPGLSVIEGYDPRNTSTSRTSAVT